jgi:SAM-dependent methyltransferase
MSAPCCRLCAAPLRHTFIDLGETPLANAYIAPERQDAPEAFYPLHVRVCSECLLVQLPELASPQEIFSDYAYFSSYSDSWLEHCRAFAAEAICRYGLGAGSRVVELASNDGYLLQYFKGAGIPVLGIEPAANVAAAAQAKGIETLVRFFGAAVAEELAAAGRRADLIVANNVLAHVPDLNDFVAGMKRLLAPGGTATVEFPHLLNLIAECQFDTIYHEHFSYFSFAVAEKAFARHGLGVADVETLPTHGGSLRLHVRHAGAAGPAPAVAALRAREEAAGLGRLETYTGFARRAEALKKDLVAFLEAQKRAGKKVAGYGAAAKGNTLLNYCGLRPELLPYVADRSREKQGRLLPGTRIPVVSPEQLLERRPDVVLILPWNLKSEIMSQLAAIRGWGGRFAVPVPALQLLD